MAWLRCRAGAALMVRYVIDTDERLLTVGEGDAARAVELYSPEAFDCLSSLWLKVGWNERYTYTFSWLGRPVIQLPDDMIRLQEVVWSLQPDVIIETGIAHGGSAVFLAGLCRLAGRGRVISVDIEIRSHNRTAIEAHPLFDLITLVEGDAIADTTVDDVCRSIGSDERVFVLLDSNHSKAHVLGELEAYAPLVTPGSFIVATDGVMSEVADTPRGEPNWTHDNPAVAAETFLESHPEFELHQPTWLFNESALKRPVTHWPGAWLRRKEN